MVRRGRKRQLDVEARYWALLANGIGTVEACRTLGIGRKTGYRSPTLANRERATTSRTTAGHSVDHTSTPTIGSGRRPKAGATDGR
jgi:hypothetical protein